MSINEDEDGIYYSGDDELEYESVLDEAKDITDGNRQQDYGSPEDNFTHIAKYWEEYLSHKGLYFQLGAKDVAMMMVLMKIARQDNKHKRDNIVDAVGYLRCLARLEGEE